MDRAKTPFVSAVVPTRNRPESLHRALRALGAQRRALDEVIVVDASDVPIDETVARGLLGVSDVHVSPHAPSVCAQRNRGVRLARGTHVLLCDDDVAPDPDYLEQLLAHLERAPGAGAVSGVLREPGTPLKPFGAPSLRHLVFAFVFQLDVHADVGAANAPWPASVVLRALRRWYARRGNTWSLAGWPLITRVEAPVTSTSVYGLGTALVRRDWLLASPYDEALGPHGIGDNYGVALGFPGREPIDLLLDVSVVHHREQANRPPADDAFFDRVLALDRFMGMRRDSTRAAPFWLAWSLLGRAAWFLVRGPRTRALPAVRAAAVVLTGRNPIGRRPVGPIPDQPDPSAP